MGSVAVIFSFHSCRSLHKKLWHLPSQWREPMHKDEKKINIRSNSLITTNLFCLNDKQLKLYILNHVTQLQEPPTEIISITN